MTSFARACDVLLRPTRHLQLLYWYPVSPHLMSRTTNLDITHHTQLFFVMMCIFFLFLLADVNFASELSDLRHRHGFQVILVHGSHTSSALLQHAHRHMAFQDITADLPPRLLVKAQVGPTNASLGLNVSFRSVLY